jgi:exopolysaccharide biosynthesis protein
MADKFIELGCVGAINLDGGGSSTFVGKDGNVLNRPSDTADTEDSPIVQRVVPTAVVIAELE